MPSDLRLLCVYGAALDLMLCRSAAELPPSTFDDGGGKLTRRRRLVALVRRAATRTTWPFRAAGLQLARRLPRRRRCDDGQRAGATSATTGGGSCGSSFAEIPPPPVRPRVRPTADVQCESTTVAQDGVHRCRPAGECEMHAIDAAMPRATASVAGAPAAVSRASALAPAGHELAPAPSLSVSQSQHSGMHGGQEPRAFVAPPRSRPAAPTRPNAASPPTVSYGSAATDQQCV